MYVCRQKILKKGVLTFCKYILQTKGALVYP